MIILSKYLSKIDKFQKRTVRFGDLKEVMPVTKLLENSGKKIWTRITSSTDSPLADLLPHKRTRLLRSRSHAYVLPLLRTEWFERFMNRCLFNYI